MRKAFTLIELLTAIAVIVLLATLATVGFRSMTENAREAQTRQAIATVNAIVSERVRAIGANVYPAEWYHNGVYGAHNTAAPGLWISPSRTWVSGSTYRNAPTTVTDATIPDDYSQWQSDLLRNTVIVFNDLYRSASARKALDGMDAVQVTVQINGAPMSARIPVDGWNRPLLFSPAVGVTVDGATAYQQSGARTYDATMTTGAVFPYVWSAGREGKPNDLVNAIR